MENNLYFFFGNQTQVNALKVVLLWEWDNPKDEERNKKRLKHGYEVVAPYLEKKREEGIKYESSVWSDNTGHMVGWFEYETEEDFVKMWGDDEFHHIMARRAYYVDNASHRLLRPTIRLPEEK